MPHYTKANLSKPNSSVLPVSIPLHNHPINRLTQVRHAMNREDIDTLARKILATGQLSRGRLVALTVDEAQQYIIEINAVWSSSHTLSSMKDCTIDGQHYYLFVVFGHRRLLACERALEMSKSLEAEPDRFDGTYLCDIYFGLRATEALVMQIGENTYVKPTVQEEVDALWRLWRFMQRESQTMTVGQFARFVGRHPDRIKEMLRFTALPEKIQARIDPTHERGALPYHMVLQLARLVAAYESSSLPFSEDQMEATLDSLLLRRVKVKDYTKEVSSRIEALQGEQADLFGVADVRVLAPRRRVVGEQIVRAVLLDMSYLEMVNRLVLNGRLGIPHPLGETENHHGEFSPYSPARLTLRLIRLLELVAPALAAQVRSEGRPSGSLEAGATRLLPTQEVLSELLTPKDL